MVTQILGFHGAGNLRPVGKGCPGFIPSLGHPFILRIQPEFPFPVQPEVIAKRAAIKVIDPGVPRLGPGHQKHVFFA